MVFFNYSTMQMTAKIVYYGPGLCGKTTNLRTIYERTTNDSRGEMVSLETETDRTLFFDLLPLEVGSVAGFQTRLQLYTVPGQVFYNTTRKLVLKGVDGVVFVADSQRTMLDANVDSLRNLEENLAEMGIELRKLPVVLQYNKRDLDDLSSVSDLNQVLNINNWPCFEASALSGQGVFDTLKEISKLTLVALKRRLVKSKSPSGARPRPKAPAAPKPATSAPTAPAPTAPVPATPAADTPASATPAPAPQPVATPALPAASEPAAGPAPETPSPAGPKRVTVKPSTGAPVAPRNRRGVDALAELEKLRKKALHSAMPTATQKQADASTNGNGELHRELQVAVTPDQLRKVRRLLLSFQLEDAERGIVESVEDFEVDVDASTGERLVVRLNILLNPHE